MEKASLKKGGRFLRKLPKSQLLTPGGMICLFLALVLDFLDYLLDIAGFLIYKGLHYEFLLGPLKALIDLLFAFLSASLLGIPFSSNLLPFLVERIPIIGTILPTWVLRFFL